jgi:hypothetical protein
MTIPVTGIAGNGADGAARDLMDLGTSFYSFDAGAIAVGP